MDRIARILLIGSDYVLWLHKKTDELTDFKIHCFHGAPKVIFVCKDRHKDIGLPKTFLIQTGNI